MAVLTNNMNYQSHFGRSLEKILEEAHLNLELNLSGRKLKDFPNCGTKYDLSDSIIVDLSKNRFTELPIEITNFWSLEKLSCSHNAIKSVPDGVLFLQSLVYLDLSRNQLTCLPTTLCDLPLETLLVSHNKLTCLPSELVRCTSLTELNVSCNQITHLPPSLGQLANLRSLNCRNNILLELPIELTYLQLTHLDLSCNRLSSLPLEFRTMTSLVYLDLDHNPFVSPPTTVCMRGRVHIFKWLALRSTKDDYKRSEENIKCQQRKISDIKLKGRSALHQVNSDSGYSTGLEWVNSPSPTKPLCVTPLSNGLNRSNDELSNSSHVKKRMERSSSEREVNYKGLNGSSSVDSGKNGVGLVNGDDIFHRQTYREYKEALKQQRSQENVYKKTNSYSFSSNSDSSSPNSVISPTPKPVQMVQPSRPVNHSPSSVQMVQPIRPVNQSPCLTPEKTMLNGHDNNTVPYVKSIGLPPTGTPPPTCKTPPVSWTDPPPDKLNFTMRREYDKAKEEASLVNQLRNNIETRLKMSLPEDLAPALSDGVVLCHLANHVRPRAVASIHVPSPAVPKLTMARCRRNVDNFLEACRKIGVEENLMCCAVDILEGRELVAVAITAEQLLKFY